MAGPTSNSRLSTGGRHSRNRKKKAGAQGVIVGGPISTADASPIDLDSVMTCQTSKTYTVHS